MLRGGCLCGSVRYEVRGAVGRITHCHCAMCRKAHGAAFGSYGTVKNNEFVVTSGDTDIGVYKSSPEVVRTFCKRCGSTLQFVSTKRPGTFSLAVGTLDDDPGVRGAAHIFVGSKAPWFDIADSLPQHEERPK